MVVEYKLWNIGGMRLSLKAKEISCLSIIQLGKIILIFYIFRETLEIINISVTQAGIKVKNEKFITSRYAIQKRGKDLSRNTPAFKRF